MSNIKIVFSDIDGTLLNDQHQITEKTLQSIHLLQEKNIPFVIVSARSPSGIYSILNEYHFMCPIIAYNGGVVLDEKKEIVFQEGMSIKRAREIIDYIEEKKYDLSWCLYSLDDWIVKDKNDSRIIREEMIVKAKARQADISLLDDERQVHKILCICNPEKTNEIEIELKQRFKECSIMRSLPTLIEIMIKGVTKENAVKRFCSLKKIEIQDAMAFGDQYNDLEMLKVVGIGISMGNAPLEIQEEVGEITLDNNHDGIYVALKKKNVIE